MDPNLTYYIYVCDEKGNISSEKEVPALTLNKGVITFTPVQWDSTKHQGTTTITASLNGELEYAVVQGQWLRHRHRHRQCSATAHRPNVG